MEAQRAVVDSRCALSEPCLVGCPGAALIDVACALEARKPTQVSRTDREQDQRDISHAGSDGVRGRSAGIEDRID